MQSTLKLPNAVAAQWLGALLCGAISLALMAWLARKLGPGEFALLGTTLNAALIALVVMEGGWSVLMYREISRQPRSRHADSLPGAAFAHVLVVFIPCTIAVAIVTPSSAVAVAAATCMFAVALMNQRSARMRAALDFSGEALWQVAGRASSAVAILGTVSFIVCCFQSDIFPSAWVFLAWAVGLAICLVCSASSWWCVPDWVAMRALFPLAISMLLVDLAIVAMIRGDLLLLSQLTQTRAATGDATTLAGYAASARLVEAVLLVVAPLANVVIAYMRGDSVVASVHSRRLVVAAAFAFWLVGCALWGVGAIWTASVFSVVFGAAFVDGASWLKWASLSLPWLLANVLLLQAAIAVSSMRTLAISVVGCAAVFVIVSVSLFPAIGAVGISIGATCSQVGLSACLLRLLYRRTQLPTEV